MEPVRMGWGDAAAPARVQVRFSDDEVLEGDAVSLDLDRPDFELVLADPDVNSRRALIPLPSVKLVTFERRAMAGTAIDDMQKVALHFNDGEVMTGMLVEGPRHGRYGVQLELVNPEGDAVELLGIPYDSLKALFYLQSWEGPHIEPPPDDAPHSLATPLVDLLGELRELAELRDRGDIDDLEFVKRRRAVLDRI